MNILRKHDFIAKQQSLHLTQKEALVEDDYVVISNFSDNYSFLQKWGCFKHISFVIVSDCLNHDTVAVHLYQQHLILSVVSLDIFQHE